MPGGLEGSCYDYGQRAVTKHQSVPVHSERPERVNETSGAGECQSQDPERVPWFEPEDGTAGGGSNSEPSPSEKVECCG